MDKFNTSAKFLIGGMGALLGLIVGAVFTVGVKETMMYMILFYFLAATIGPRILYEFGNAWLKIYLISGPIGISFIKLSIKIFASDGKISDKEVNKLKNYMIKEFGNEIGQSTEKYIMRNPQISETIYSICQPLKDMKSSYRITFLYQMFAMAASDGTYSDKEELVLKQIARYLRIGSKRFFIIKSSVIRKTETKDSSTGNKYSESKKQHSEKGYQFLQQFFVPAYNPYFILGIEQNASIEEIKSTYRKLVKKYHPDLIMQKSELHKKKAKEKIQEINEAYESVKKMRGIK